jgi:hypothetical protein
VFRVVDIDWEWNGTVTRRLLYQSSSVASCWAFISYRINHPSRLVREEGERLFVFDKTGQMQFREKPNVEMVEVSMGSPRARMDRERDGCVYI